MEDKEGLKRIERWKTESSQFRAPYESRWAKNAKLIKGIFSEQENSFSEVRNKHKIFYRKIWATRQRVVASLYQSFLRSQDSFKVLGRGAEDVQKASVTQKAVEWRRDEMMRKKNLFKKHIWAFNDILDYGVCYGKWGWEFNEEGERDHPTYTIYPVDQVYLDFRAPTEEEMQYVIFENYMTMDELLESGYDNIDEMEPASIPSNELRSVRFHGKNDPLQNPSDGEYPTAGSYEGEEKENTSNIYIVWEVFYKENDRIMFTVTNEGKHYLKEPQESVFGDIFPITIGSCLTESHQIIGEGLPESLEGPQESYNFNLNQRKDNVALAINGFTVVSRYGNVDMQALTNSEPGGIVMADDTNAVSFRNVPDVTGSSYAEAAADDAMIQEMSGVTSSKMGQSKDTKATVAQINLTESNAKIDLYIALVGETYMRDWYYKLTKLIMLFETDETVLRVANDSFRKDELANKSPLGFSENEYILDDFDMDIDIQVGAGVVSRDLDINRALLAMDRINMSNQAMAQFMQMGVIRPEQAEIYSSTKIMEELLLPKLDIRNVADYKIELKPPPPPPPQGQAGTGVNPSLAGAAAQPPPNVIPEGNIGGAF